jgi:hypothetical protein
MINLQYLLFSDRQTQKHCTVGKMNKNIHPILNTIIPRSTNVTFRLVVLLLFKYFRPVVLKHAVATHLFVTSFLQIIPNLEFKLLVHVILHLFIVWMLKCDANFSFSKCVLPLKKKVENYSTYYFYDNTKYCKDHFFRVYSRKSRKRSLELWKFYSESQMKQKLP